MKLFVNISFSSKHNKVIPLSKEIEKYDFVFEESPNHIKYIQSAAYVRHHAPFIYTRTRVRLSCLLVVCNYEWRYRTKMVRKK
jgi:hypothetical protein